ncbi:MAG: TIR domain-containing protein [Cognatishimia activa]
MARRSTSSDKPQNALLTLEQMQQAVPRLKKRISKLKEFQPEAFTTREEASSATQSLNASIDDALTRTFGSSTVEYYRYSSAANLSWPLNVFEPTPLHQIISSLAQDKIEAIALLEMAIESLEEQIEEAGGSTAANIAPSRASVEGTRKIFVVHGHDVGAREALARFLEQCDFEPIVLHEQANSGRTIIEKFEDNSDVGFAVVLLTPDDEVLDSAGESVMRARQNVILELGYFIGRLGRDRVCALKSGEIEIPSDILGVIWTEFDAQGGWKQSLAKELKAANFDIDWNKVMS